MTQEHTKGKSKILPVVIIVCSTMVLLSAIGSWVYLNQQQIAQKDRQLQQEKQLKEYEQEQLNKRNEEDNRVKRLNDLNDTDNPYTRF